MYLSNIELFGFKSFAHRIRIAFDKGLTAIVGPNGCGKTNVVDAIRWVLGEQRSSLLRSAKMENIIFNGSKNLKPLSLTEVSITIENTRNVLPVEYTEVTVTRRLYRNGESNYLLNQVPCRLKDILDLFTDTGMGYDAYSVIELKMIEEIISNKNEERLKLFEEAAGITRYKQRRKQTFKQLESASRDLSRVDDVIAEVEKKVRSLKLQVRKTKKLQELKEEAKKLDFLLGGLKLYEQFEKIGPLKQQIEREEALCHELAAAIALSDSALQEAELMQLRREEELATAQKQLNTNNAVIHELEKKLLHYEEQQKNLHASLLANKRSLQEKQEKTRKLEELHTEQLARKKPFEETSAARLQEYSTLATEQEKLNIELQEKRAEIAEKRRAISETDRTLGKLLLQKNSLENSREHLEKSLRRIEQTKSASTLQIAKSLAARHDTENTISHRETRIEEFRQRENDLKQQINELAAEIEFRREELLRLKTEREALNNQISLISAILDNFEDLPQGIAFLEKRKTGGAMAGCLADLIALDAQHRRAVHAALGEALGYYISPSLDEARKSMELLMHSKKGKLHFLVLELTGTLPETATPVIENATSILSLLSYPEEISAGMKLLLGNHYLVENLEKAEQLSHNHREAVFVTPEGTTFSAKGVLYGGSPYGNKGVRLGKKAERDLLRKQEREIQQRIGKRETALHRLRQKLEAVESRLREVRIQPLQQELALLERTLVRIDTEERSLRQSTQQAERETSEITARLGELESDLAGLAPEITSREQKRLLTQQTAEQLQETLMALETRYHSLNRHVRELQSRQSDAQLELEKLLLGINATEQTMQAVREDMQRLEWEAAEAERNIAESNKSAELLKHELENHRIRSAEKQVSVSKLETICRELQARNQNMRTEQRELRRKHEIGRKLVDELQLERQRAEQQLDHLTTSISVRYNCELEPVDPAAVPDDFDRTAAEDRLHSLRKQHEQFGAVNELAFEEYEIEKKRLDFLLEQKEDLLSAEIQLRNTIEEINKTALRKFRETYDAVRKNFISIFHELFDSEDEVDLLLNNAEDPLESHLEIIARPRGKKPLSIEQLSGGEKALTALSLLFAIYLVKPSPFCILDEVDAPLDDANVARFIKLLKKFEKNTQFIIVTHNKKSMASCQALYGVTMEEEGVSKLIPVRLEKSP